MLFELVLRNHVVFSQLKTQLTKLAEGRDQGDVSLQLSFLFSQEGFVLHLQVLEWNFLLLCKVVLVNYRGKGEGLNHLASHRPIRVVLCLDRLWRSLIVDVCLRVVHKLSNVLSYRHQVVFADVGHEVLLLWVLQGLLQDAMCHVLFSSGERWDLLCSNKLDWTIRVWFHHLSRKVRCALDAPFSKVFRHPGCRL